MTDRTLTKGADDVQNKRFCSKKQSLHRPECGFMQAIPVRTGLLCQQALP